MRPTRSAALACLLLLAGTTGAAAGPDWVVLRVERVEVAVARADGSPWDDASPTEETCGLVGGDTYLLRSKTWGPVARTLCPPRGGADPSAPDLFLRLADADAVEFVSPIIADKLAHDFRYQILVPLDAIATNAITMSVHDSDGEGSASEVLGTISLTQRDIDLLLVKSDRVKTYSNDSVSRIDLSARRYKHPPDSSVKLRAKQHAVRAPTSVIAGEIVTIRVSPPTAHATALVGAGLNAVAVRGCVRGIATASGDVAVGIYDGAGTLGRDTNFTVTTTRPSLALWTSGAGHLSCDNGGSVVTIKTLQSLGGSSLLPVAVRPIVRSRYLAGIKRCHERALVKKRSARGRVNVRFTVGPTGGVTKASVKGFDQEVDTCVKSLIVKWRFPAPKDPDGKATSEDFDMELLLDSL